MVTCLLEENMLLPLRYWLISRVQKGVMLCKYRAASSHLFLYEIKFSMELMRSCCQPKQRPILCSIFLSFIGLWVKVGMSCPSWQQLVASLNPTCGTVVVWPGNLVPYSKLNMLHGIPGSGKTSVITTVASHFGLNVAIIPFTSTTPWPRGSCSPRSLIAASSLQFSCDGLPVLAPWTACSSTRASPMTASKRCSRSRACSTAWTGCFAAAEADHDQTGWSWSSQPTWRARCFTRLS